MSKYFIYLLARDDGYQLSVIRINRWGLPSENFFLSKLNWRLLTSQSQSIKFIELIILTTWF